MTDSIKTYLSGFGFENIYIDMMPAAEKVKDAVGIFEWSNPRSKTTGETSHYIQFQVRHTNYDSARSDCGYILELLDSGTEERLIRLDGSTSCIGSVRKGPLLLERGAGYVTFYGEMVFWKNE